MTPKEQRELVHLVVSVAGSFGIVGWLWRGEWLLSLATYACTLLLDLRFYLLDVLEELRAARAAR